MEPTNTDKNPAAKPNSASAAPVEAPPPEDNPQKSKKKAVLVILLVLILLAAAAAAYFLTKDNKELSTSSAQSTKTEAKKDVVLTYVTKLDKTSKVQVKNATKNTTTEEVSFSEPYAFDPRSGNVWEASKASASLSADGKELAYIKDNNLIVRNVTNDKEETLVKKTSTGGSSETFISINLEPAPPKGNGPGLARISNPVWSRDGKAIGFSLAYYEGGGVAVINRVSKNYVALGDTFRYVTEEGLGAKFTLIAESKELVDLGIYGSYLVKEYGALTSPEITLDGKKLLTVLCPLNEPNTGNHKYSETYYTGAQLENMKNLRDCGETGNRSLISGDLTTGEYKEVGTGKFGESLALQAGDFVYVAGSKDSGHNITKISLDGSKPSTLLDIKKLGELEAGDTVEGTIVKTVSNAPIVEIYLKNGAKHFVKVVNLQTEKLVTSVELEANMGYSTLGLTQ